MRMDTLQLGFASQTFDEVPNTYPVQRPALLGDKQSVDFRADVHLGPLGQPPFESCRFAVKDRMRTRDAAFAPAYVDFAGLKVNITQAKCAQLAHTQSMAESQKH